MRAYSVHLDSERTSNRTKELRALFVDASPESGAVDVICGDINEDTIIGSAIADEIERIEENFRRTGSDHYPIAGTLEF